MQHCATTFVGVTGGSIVSSSDFGSSGSGTRFIDVLEEMVACSLNETCINPPGATRANHRQEQTVMNSIFCRERLRFMCTNDKSVTLSTDFENDRDRNTVYPTTDETDFNSIELYTRRVHPVKPYIKHLEKEEKIN